jgi:hypothetical protein
MYLFKTREDLARELGINRKTLDEKLKMANINLPKGLVSPIFQKLIYDYFGVYPPDWVLPPNYPNSPQTDPNNPQLSPK